MATESATTNDYLRGRSKKVARTAKVRERKLERLIDSADMIDKPDRRWTMAAEFMPAATNPVAMSPCSATSPSSTAI